VRPHTVRRPRLALGDGAAMRVSGLKLTHKLTKKKLKTKKKKKKKNLTGRNYHAEQVRLRERAYCLCVFCVGPLCGPPLRWWVLCGALPSVRVPCVGPSSRRAAFHVASTRVMSLARSHAPAYVRTDRFPV